MTLYFTARPMTINKNAFYNCTSITSVIVSNNVTVIEKNVFYNCVSLQTLVWSDEITSIGEGAFQGCEALLKLSLPSALTEIGEAAFAGCSGLSSVTFKTVTGWSAGDATLDLTNPTQNAVYLSETYLTEKWVRE